MTYTYSDDLISDLHKEVYGRRPTASFWMDWYTASQSQKQDTWDEYCRVNDLQEIESKAQEVRDVAAFEARIQDVISLGASNRVEALRWISESETFYHGQDVEHFVWEQGILFTKYGKQLVKDLLLVVKYKECA